MFEVSCVRVMISLKCLSIKRRIFVWFMAFLSPKLIVISLPLYHPTFALSLSVPIRGADIVAKTTLEVVPGTPLTYEWKGHGMKLYILADALKPGTPAQTMTIQASLSGQYQLPDDAELVSGVYWVAFPRRFSQPVTLELQHCAYLEHPEDVSSLFFVRAKCSQKNLPYQFQALPGGAFSTNTRYGAIELRHFSGVGLARRKRKRKQEEGNEAKKERKYYIGKIFYIPQTNITWLMHFTVICALDLSLKVCAKCMYTGGVINFYHFLLSGSGKVLLRYKSRGWPLL